MLERLRIPGIGQPSQRRRSGQRGVPFYHRMRLTAADRADLYRAIAVYVRKGKSLKLILARMRDEISRVRRQDVRVAFCRSALRHLELGDDIGDAIRAWVPSNEALVVQGGQSWGTNDGLAQGFDEAAELAESQAASIKHATTKLAYPAIVTVAFIGVGALMAFEFVPQMAEASDPSEWGGATAALYDFSVFFRAFWDTVLIVVLAVLVAVIMSLPGYTGVGRGVLDRIPPWNLYRSFMGASLLLALSSMERSGKKFSAALRDASEGATPYLQSWLRLIRRRLRMGDDPIDALDCKFLEMESRITLRIASDSDELGEVLHTLAVRQLKGVQTRIGVVASLITVIAMGLIVVGIFMSYSALYGTMSTSAAGGGF